MIRKLVLFVVSVVLLSIPGQGAADAAAGHLKIPTIGVDAAIVKVPVKNGHLMIGHKLQGIVYTAQGGDPPCDPTGSTVYVGHAWRDGHGVADRWGTLKKGDIITLPGCKAKVVKVRFPSDNVSIRKLSRVDGPPMVHLVGCKADNYDKATIVTAKVILDDQAA